MNPMSNTGRLDPVDFRIQLAARVSEVREHFDFGLADLRREMRSGFERVERKLDRVLDKLGA
jgi:hypothetical protein